MTHPSNGTPALDRLRGTDREHQRGHHAEYKFASCVACCDERRALMRAIGLDRIPSLTPKGDAA